MFDELAGLSARAIAATLNERKIVALRFNQGVNHRFGAVGRRPLWCNFRLLQ